MSQYSEKLKDPRWQKKRLQVLERAGWQCQCCYDKEEMLQVHHLIYSKGEPWDAPDETLECLCRSCHEWREDFNSKWGGRGMRPTGQCLFFEEIFSELFQEKTKPKSESFAGLLGDALANFKAQKAAYLKQKEEREKNQPVPEKATP